MDSTPATHTICIRGATTVDEDSEEQILEATCALLRRMAEANEVSKVDIISIMFTGTPDIHSVFPAAAARRIGWTDVPLMCAQEMTVLDAPRLCIRVLMQVESAVPRGEAVHVYERGAIELRPDLAKRKE